MGACFVRRSPGDAVHRVVLQRCVQMGTGSGVPQAVFPQGGLTARRNVEERAGLYTANVPEAHTLACDANAIAHFQAGR